MLGRATLCCGTTTTMDARCQLVTISLHTPTIDQRAFCPVTYSTCIVGLLYAASGWPVYEVGWVVEAAVWSPRPAVQTSDGRRAGQSVDGCGLKSRLHWKV